MTLRIRASLAVLPVLAVVMTAGTPGTSAHEQSAPGSIVGHVELRPPPQRRSVSRYAGGPSATRGVQAVAAVAYLVGDLPSAASRATPTRVAIAQRDTAFVPSAVVVSTGSVVAFPNEDDFYHNVFSYSGNARFDLGRYPRGQSKNVTFTEPGMVKIYCEVHEFMRAVVLVTDHPFHSVVSPEGNFRIGEVPPGSYTLVVSHPDVGETRREVTVRDGETLRVSMVLSR